MKFIFSVLSFVFLTSYSYGKSITVDPQSPATLEINGPIDFQMTLPLVDSIVAQAKSGHEITIIIKSPGGEVNAGMYLLSGIELAQARGTKFRCITTGLAASMAFQIFSKCDSRYALPNSFMLYHPVRITIGGGVFSEAVHLTPALAKQLSDELARMDAFLVADLRKSMKVSDETFNRNYTNETLLLAREVNADSPNWLTLVNDVVGLSTITFGKSNKLELKKSNKIKIMHICTSCY
jgi:ATP-dependent Clp protease protease subunit